MSDEQKVPVYVGFWLRFLAFLIDSIILLVVIVPILLAIFGTDYLELAGAGKTMMVDFWVQFVLPAVAAILFWKFRGATPGKMLISARVVDAETLGPLSTGQAIGRYFSYLLSMLPLMLGFLWMAFDKRKQGWHDKLAHTVVIRDRKPR